MDLFPKIDWKYFRTILRLVTILKYLNVFIYRILTLTIAYKFWKPLTRVGILENFWLNASEILWAGSVEMIRTLSRTLASCVAKQQLQQIRKNMYVPVILIHNYRYYKHTAYNMRAHKKPIPIYVHCWKFSEFTVRLYIPDHL